MAKESQPCAHCGAVMPLSKMLTLDQAGEQVVLCQGCAIATPTGDGTGAEPARSASSGSARRRRKA